MNSLLKKIEVTSKRQFELIDVTSHVKTAVAESGVIDGIANVYSTHTTAAIRVNHKESMLAQDIMKSLYSLVPIEASYTHDVFEMSQTVSLNDRSNGHAHVKAFLLGASENIPIKDSELQLGAKQNVFFVELDGSRKRDFLINIIGQ